MASRAPGRIYMKFDNYSMKTQLKNGLVEGGGAICLIYLHGLWSDLQSKIIRQTKQIKNKAGNSKVLWKPYKNQDNQTKKTMLENYALSLPRSQHWKTLVSFVFMQVLQHSWNIYNEETNVSLDVLDKLRNCQSLCDCIMK